MTEDSVIEPSIALSPQILHGLMWALNTYQLCGRETTGQKIKNRCMLLKILVEIYSAFRKNSIQ